MFQNSDDKAKHYEHEGGGDECTLAEYLIIFQNPQLQIVGQMNQFSHISGGIKADIESINLSD